MAARSEYGFCTACRTVVPAGRNHTCPPPAACLRCGATLPPAIAGICRSCAKTTLFAPPECKHCGGIDPKPVGDCDSLFHVRNRGVKPLRGI